MTPPMPEKADPVSALGWEEYRKAKGWPTPNHMRHAADALDMLAIPKYGDILRWVADACDAALSGEAPDRDGERLRAALESGDEPITAILRRYAERVAWPHSGYDPGPPLMAWADRIDAALAPSLEGARPTYTVVETLQSPDKPPSDLHLRGARHPEAGETT